MNNILVPTDFSPTSQNSSEYAAQFAKAVGAKMTLYHAFHIPAPVTGVPAIVVSPEEMQAENIERMQGIVKDLKSKYGSDIDIECKSKIGFAVEGITEECESDNYDMIVMGIAGASQIAEVLIGSSTTAVMRYSKIPVLVIPAEANYTDVNHITFAWDLHKIEHPENFYTIFDIAKKYNSKMDVVHIVEEGKKAEVDMQAETSHIQEFAKDFGFTFSVTESENLVDGLNECIDKFGSDMVALIPQKHSFFERLISEPSSKKMAFHTHVPLITIPA